MKFIDDITSHKHWKRYLAVGLVVVTVIIYYLRWHIFANPYMHNEMLRYIFDDLAFMCIQILIVTVVLETYLQRREMDALRQKLNMIIGAFFSQFGFEMLHELALNDAKIAEIKDVVSPQMNWTHRDFERAHKIFEQHAPEMKPTPDSLRAMEELIRSHKDAVLTLLTNQALLDHETFADLLWAISHIGDELGARHNYDALPESDMAHLALDMKRAYQLFGFEWLNYLEHLQSRYPYLYSLAVRNNPLAHECNVEVCELS